ncbi:MAG: LysM peptidoglycan-binding domain-containing protein, partial [Thermomicrobiales bacterium]|nr:LysM peptidoglycan-binding domain-containing protein [Thermomicrobiales bacterium]
MSETTRDERDASGLIGLYADRALGRGADPRQLVSDYRAAIAAAGRPQRSTAPHPAVVGRGTTEHRLSVKVQAAPRRTPSRRAARPTSPALGSRPGRRLAMAGMAAALLLSLGVFAAGAESPAFQTRYVVQPGDTLASVAEEFGVDPQAILAASTLQAAPWLTPNETLVIPAPEQDPESAAAEAAVLQGISPFVVGAHVIAPGESIGEIAGWNGIDAPTLAAFNGVTDIDAVDPGQRLLIPAIFGLPGLPGGDGLTFDDGAAAAPGVVENGDATGVGGAVGWAGATIVEGAPTYQQRYGMSCEYAAAHIATETFGAGIDEEVFRQNIAESPNPHWGYRGYIDGGWGGVDDYGIYP